MKIEPNFQPDFLGIGTTKSGSSMLADLLMQHPEITWASRKEVNYFNKYHSDGSPNPYHEQPYSFYTQFYNLNSSKKKGEFSPIYLYDRHAIDIITTLFPKIRLFIILRHPVNRCFSHYLYCRDFLQSIESDISFESAIKKYPFLINMGFYGAQIEHLFQRISEEQVKIIIFEETIQDPQTTIQVLYEHIGVSPDFIPDIKKVNSYKKVKRQWIQNGFESIGHIKSRLYHNPKTARWIDSMFNTKPYLTLLAWKHSILDANVEKTVKPELDSEAYTKLEAIYHDDMLLLKTLLKRNDPIWHLS